jgi:hypothetical protein
VVYDISVNALNITSEATDLAVNITGNASSVDIGDTVHLVISLSNLGPRVCDAKLNYKIPVGLKLLSSQGPGVYDSVSGVWNAGVLLVNDSVSLDLVLQVLGAGVYSHVVDVFDSLNVSNNHMVWSMVCASVLGNVTPTIVSSSAFDGLKPINNGGSGNGGGSGGSGGSGNDGNDQNDNQKPDEKPKPGVKKGNDQLYRDQMYIRDYVGYVGSNNHDGSNDQGDNQNDDRDNPNKPPQMPGWEIDTSILDTLILAMCLVSSGLIGAELAKREFGGLYGKTTIKDLMEKSPLTPNRVMVASLIATILSPPTLKAEILLVTGLLISFLTLKGYTIAGKTNAYSILTLTMFIISLSILFSKLGEDPGKALKESVLGQIFELIKKFFN